jgi:hypothetical protein
LLRTSLSWRGISDCVALGGFFSPQYRRLGPRGPRAIPWVASDATWWGACARGLWLLVNRESSFIDDSDIRRRTSSYPAMELSRDALPGSRLNHEVVNKIGRIEGTPTPCVASAVPKPPFPHPPRPSWNHLKKEPTPRRHLHHGSVSPK